MQAVRWNIYLHLYKVNTLIEFDKNIIYDNDYYSDTQFDDCDNLINKRKIEIENRNEY